MQAIIAILAFVLIMFVGVKILRAMARPVPPEPEDGEMRRVNLTYRCQVCAMEIRVRKAISATPEPPKHCLEEMVLVAPAFD